ncbi:hypothetical protein UFOVP690_5 [uncultured Caudovirales phage]|uniref:Uncharacterized protein n=1 Tax=uncultured Caudovirales phage TaxID=2100421 RepID=A0A6J5NE41_9CAUD|nr:hypothetical protein UFOVP690_5 [uncultured Caudovirales phage]
MTKNNYLMGQEYLLRLENECLIERISKLEKELGLKEKEIKDLRNELKPFLTERQKRDEYLKRRDEMDLQISQMFANFHNKMK